MQQQKMIFCTINKKAVKDFKVSLKYNGPLKAPIKKGDEIGDAYSQGKRR